MLWAALHSHSLEHAGDHCPIDSIAALAVTESAHWRFDLSVSTGTPICVIMWLVISRTHSHVLFYIFSTVR